MTLWLIFAALTLGALAVLLVPLLRNSDTATPRAAYDIAVYRNQLAEIEEEATRGLIAPELADGARAEVQRRMIAAAQTPEATSETRSRRSRWALAAILAVIVPVGSGLLYHALGSPSLPGQAYAARIKRDPAVALAAAADRLDRKLESQPDAAGYRRLADQYVFAHEFAHARAAFQRAIMLGSDDAATWSKLGEAIVLGSGGSITPQALAAFTHALMRDPSEPRARFYAGIAQTQIGHFERAVSIWRDLERDSKPDAAWAPLLRAHIDAFANRGGFDPDSIPPKPPSVAAMNTALAAMAGTMTGQHDRTNARTPPPRMDGTQ